MERAEHGGLEPREIQRPEVRHERSDLSVRAVAIFAAALAIFAALTHLALAYLLGYLAFREARPEREAPAKIARQSALPPEPRLQASPARDMAKMREEEERRLHSYGWVDRSAGVVRIPIERAKQLVVERGLPARPAQAAGTEGAG